MQVLVLIWITVEVFEFCKVVSGANFVHGQLTGFGIDKNPETEHSKGKDGEGIVYAADSFSGGIERVFAELDDGRAEQVGSAEVEDGRGLFLGDRGGFDCPAVLGLRIDPPGLGIGEGVGLGNVGLDVEDGGMVEEVALIDMEGDPFDVSETNAGKADGVRTVRTARGKNPDTLVIGRGDGRSNGGSPMGISIKEEQEPDSFEAIEVTEGIFKPRVRVEVDHSWMPWMETPLTRNGVFLVCAKGVLIGADRRKIHGGSIAYVLCSEGKKRGGGR